ncbi:MAG: IS110 family transposase [Microthrixaceae bacterium]|nr:IS110 family transposase [Microthrixaceae bacterium]
MTVTVGLDIGETDHGVYARDDTGTEIGLGPVSSVVKRAKVANDQRSLDVLFAWIATLAGDGGWVLAIDQIGSYARLVIAAAAAHGAQIAYVPGLVAHRAAELFPGQAKTDQPDAQVLCDVARASPINSAGSTLPTTNWSPNWPCCAATTKTSALISTGCATR